MRPERRSPPSALGRASPCLRSKLRQRIALDALTPKRCAACLHETPPAIAASTRVLRSSESAFDMSPGLRPEDSLNHPSADLGIVPSHSDHALEDSFVSRRPPDRGDGASRNPAAPFSLESMRLR